MSFGIALGVHHCCGWRITIKEKESRCSQRICLILLIVITCVAAYHSLCAYMGDDDLFSSDLSDDQLKQTLGHMSNTPCQNQSWFNQLPSFRLDEPERTSFRCETDHLAIPNDGTDVWEIDSQNLIFDRKVASGSYGDLYRGTYYSQYYSQEVAIKVLKTECVTAEMQGEPRSIYNEVVKVADFGVARVRAVWSYDSRS